MSVKAASPQNRVAVTTGFVELGAGNYLWSYSSFPDGFRGAVKFYTGTLPTGIKAATAINPEEADTAPSATKIADVVLRRQMTNVEGSSDGDGLSLSSLYGSIQTQQQANTTAHAGKLTAFKTDGTTELGRLDLASDPTAEPITGVS